MNKTQNTKNQINLTTKPNMLVTRKTVAWISYNFKLSDKAKEQALKYFTLNKSIRQRIFESPLAWKNNNGYCIALDLFNYLVVETVDELPVIQEIIDTSEISNNFTVVDQMFKDYKSFKTNDEYAMIELLWEKSFDEPIDCALIQETLSCGYALASSIIDYLEDNEIVSKRNNDENSKRKVLCDKAKFITYFSDALNRYKK